MKSIKIFDTTLRDGEQGIDFQMNVSQKSLILDKIDDLNLNYIEIGFPAASAADFEWAKFALSKARSTKISILSRLNKDDINTILMLPNYQNIQVQLLGVGSEIHLEKKRKITKEESFKELKESIAYLKENGINDITVIFEDATRGSYRLLSEASLICADLGISGITIADTVGCATPLQIANLIKHIKNILPAHMDLGIHCHNDLGLAVANTLSAIQSGANVIHTTLGGIGERAGNCALEEIFSVLHFSDAENRLKLNLNPKKIFKTAKFIFKLLGKKFAVNKPILGKHVFSTAAGIHQDGLIKDKKVYEHVEAEVFGEKNKLIFNRLSGRKMININIQECQNSPELSEIFYRYLIQKNSNFDEKRIVKEFNLFKIKNFQMQSRHIENKKTTALNGKIIDEANEFIEQTEIDPTINRCFKPKIYSHNNNSHRRANKVNRNKRYSVKNNFYKLCHV